MSLGSHVINIGNSTPRSSAGSTASNREASASSLFRCAAASAAVGSFAAACQAAARAVPWHRVEQALTYAGCASFVAAGTMGIVNGTDRDGKINNSLIIGGAICYAAVGVVGSVLSDRDQAVVNLLKMPLLGGALGTFVAYGIRQYREGGSESILAATIIFAAAILARAAHNTLKVKQAKENGEGSQEVGRSPALLFALLAHYTCALSGATIFLVDNAAKEHQDQRFSDPAWVSAMGAAMFTSSKALGLILAVSDAISHHCRPNPEENKLLNGAADAS